MKLPTFFEALVKLGLSPKDLARRKAQVPEEEIAHVENEDYSPAAVHMQRHDAARAGLHRDLRLVVGDSKKAISFVPPKGLPKKSGERRLLIRQPDHVAEYSTWEGTIPAGEYGAGTVTLEDSAPAIARTHRDRIDVDILRGENAGRYVFRRLGGRHWLAIRRGDPVHHWEERPPMGVGHEAMLDHPDWAAEKKYDGVHVIARFDADRGVSLAARSKSATGGVSGKEAHVPWLRDVKVPRSWHGVVARGELYHPELPFSAVSAILLSKPHTAVAAQRKVGPLRLALFSLVRAPKGRELSPAPYEGHARALSNLAQDMSNPLIHFAESANDGTGDFYRKVVGSGGEGVVLKHRLTNEQYKLTRSTAHDLRVAGFEPGSGNLAGKGVGSFLVADKHGRVVAAVGSGITAQMRQDAMKNPQKYLHRIVRIEAKELTPEGSLRHPVFVGFTTDKHEADHVPVAKMASIVHRDVKPQNFTLAALSGLAKLALSKRERDKLPPQVGDSVLVNLEKGRGFKIVAMGETVGRGTNPADGDPWDVIVADAPGGAGGRFHVTIVGVIKDPTGNHKWIATKDGGELTQKELAQIRAYRAARQELMGKKMKIELPGVRDRQIKVAVGQAGPVLLETFSKEAKLSEKLERLGVTRREKADPSDSVCSIGTNEKGTWWGWSHRAIADFKAGDKLPKDFTCDGEYGSEDLRGYVIKDEADAKRVAKAFARSVS